MKTLVEQIDWAKGDGLVPAVVQSERTLQVLMLGYMNQAALEATLSTGKVTFYSRTKGLRSAIPVVPMTYTMYPKMPYGASWMIPWVIRIMIAKASSKNWLARAARSASALLMK